MAAEDTIFFSPNPLPFPKPTPTELANGSAVRIVRFLNEPIAKTPWIVGDIVLPEFGAFLDRSRWEFVNVVKEDPNVMRANLHFKTVGFATSVVPEDILLRMAWDGLVSRSAVFQLRFNTRGVSLPVVFSAA
jgi:hypothetical protein